MKEIDLLQILRDCPKGTKLWSPLFGDLALSHVGKRFITTKILSVKNSSAIFTSQGKYMSTNVECLLFPSKDMRDWSRFQQALTPFHPKDWCLMRRGKERFPHTWRLCRFAYKATNGEYEAVGGFRYKECLPYDDSTKHLLGTALDYKP